MERNVLFSISQLCLVVGLYSILGPKPQSWGCHRVWYGRNGVTWGIIQAPERRGVGTWDPAPCLCRHLSFPLISELNPIDEVSQST